MGGGMCMTMWFQSQTGSQALSDASCSLESDMGMGGSIPNGKSSPLRLRLVARKIDAGAGFQSQTGSQALSDRAFLFRSRVSRREFQSQTGSQALSDDVHRHNCIENKWFQSQTGSQALSDQSIPLCRWGSMSGFNPKREVRPSQTLSPDFGPVAGESFNPKREVRPSQTLSAARLDLAFCMFQSQTGSQALSDLNCCCGKAGHQASFQSQTGSQALSDAIGRCRPRCPDGVSIPNGKSGPLRPCAWRY